jgi:hypothetical protein
MNVELASCAGILKAWVDSSSLSDLSGVRGVRGVRGVSVAGVSSAFPCPLPWLLRASGMSVAPGVPGIWGTEKCERNYTCDSCDSFDTWTPQRFEGQLLTTVSYLLLWLPHCEWQCGCGCLACAYVKEGGETSPCVLLASALQSRVPHSSWMPVAAMVMSRLPFCSDVPCQLSTAALPLTRVLVSSCACCLCTFQADATWPLSWLAHGVSGVLTNCR